MVDTCLTHSHTHHVFLAQSHAHIPPPLPPLWVPSERISAAPMTTRILPDNGHPGTRNTQYTSDEDRPDLPWLRRSCCLHDTVSVYAVPAYQVTRDRLNVEPSWRAAVVCYNRNSVSECRHAALTKVTSPGHLPGPALPSPPPPPHPTPPSLRPLSFSCGAEIMHYK